MTDQATRVVPAGWYEDPSDPGKVRWWNGIAWTDHTQPKPDLDAVADAETAALEQTFNASSTATRARGRVASTSTSASWLLAFSPVLWVLAVTAAISINLYYVQTPVLWAILVIPYALGVLWAFLDVKKLRRWGHTPPAAFWGFFGPLVYLIVRKTKVAGWGQLGTFIGIVAIGGLMHAALWSTDVAKPLAFAVQIQTEIRDELVGSGQASAVACPPIADTMTVGALYTCDVTMTDGSHRSLWVSIDSDEGDYSYSFSIG